MKKILIVILMSIVVSLPSTGFAAESLKKQSNENSGSRKKQGDKEVRGYAGGNSSTPEHDADDGTGYTGGH